MDFFVHTPSQVSRGISRWFALCSVLVSASSSCAEHRSREPALRSVKTVTVWPDTVTLSRGDTMRFRALSRAEHDATLDGRSVTWSTSDSSIVTVADGLVTAKRRGSANIIATSQGIAGSARVNVANRALREANGR